MTSGPSRRLGAFVACCFALFLARVFALHGFCYFLLDDFNNISMAMVESYGSLLRYTLDPFSDYFRPFAMLTYRVLWRWFDLDPLPYHACSFILHTLNVGLVYLLLARVLHARYAAACGALLFAYQSSYALVLWEFGGIFELWCCALFLLAVHAHLRVGRSFAGMLLCSLVFYLAMKSKEMAITLPQVWLLSEWLGVGDPEASAGGTGLRVPLRLRDVATRYAVPGAIQVWFFLFRMAQMREEGAADPYFVRYSPRVWATQTAWYLNGLLRPVPAEENPPSWPWLLLGALLLATLVFYRSRVGLFFCAFVPLTMLPIVFLVNHRCAFFWYIPFVGLSGLFALAVRRVEAWLARRAPPRRVLQLAALAFALFAVVHYEVQSRRGRAEREWAAALSLDYRTFLTGLRALPPPQADEVLYFRSLPSYFNGPTLKSALEVALGRPDVKSAIVARFPEDARYRLAFEDGRLIRLPNSPAGR